MKTFAKIIIAAAAAAAAVVVTKKVIDEIEKIDKNSKIVKGYKKAVNTVKGIVNCDKAGKPRKFDTDGYDIDFYNEDDENCRCMCDECLFDDGCDKDGDYFAFDNAEEDQDFFDDTLDFIQTENAEPTEEEILEIINEEMAQEQIDKILSEMDAEDKE